MAIAVVLNTQNTPIPINTPNADSQNVYQNVSGKFKLAGADKNSNPIKFAFGVPGIFGSPAPYHLPTISGVNKPTDDQLNALASTATTDYNNSRVRKTRKRAYGDIGDQLDEIFKDIDAWKVRIQAIKDANAKE